MNSHRIDRMVLAVEGPSDERRLRVLLRLPPYSDVVVDVDVLQIKTIPDLVRSLGLPRYAPNIEASRGDGATLRKLYQVLKAQGRLVPGTVLVWARDTDAQPERRTDVTRARDALPPHSVPIVLAVATECGEAWVIAGYQRSAMNKVVEEQLRRELGFEPWTKPELLSHKQDAPKSAKRVLAQLFAGERDEEDVALRRAWNSTRAEVVSCGLSAFREEFERLMSNHVLG